MHRAEIPRADHIKGILACADATSGDDVTLLKIIENLTLQQILLNKTHNKTF